MAIPGIEDASTFLGNLIAAEGLTIIMVDSDGSQYTVPPMSVTDADGFLPVFLAAAEAVWEDATGGGFGLIIDDDLDSLLGYRAKALADVPFSVVALTILHVIETAREGNLLRTNSLVPIAAAARARIKVQAEPTGPNPSTSPSPR